MIPNDIYERVILKLQVETKGKGVASHWAKMTHSQKK